MEIQMNLPSIKTTLDVHYGFHITIDDQQQITKEEFEIYLNQAQTSQKYRSIWVELTTKNISLLDLLTNKLNFKIHSGLGKNIVVYKWLSPRADLVVPYSVFWVAAGALLIHNNKVLLVQEKGGDRKGKYGVPGGRANRGQLISHCAQRQLFEQTGVKAKFQRIVFIRQLTQGQIYNCVDIYFVCLMRLEPGGLDNMKMCQREISNYAWVDLQEYQQFCKNNSVGTQIPMSKHVSKLYRQNRLFNGSQYSFQTNYIKNSCMHRL